MFIVMEKLLDLLIAQLGEEEITKILFIIC